MKINKDPATEPILRIEEDDVACIVGVHCFFNDIEKTALWFNTPNPMLGEIIPMKMLLFGRVKKLRQFIEQQLAENGEIDGTEHRP